MMSDFRFGVNTLIWTEKFTEKDIWILPRIKELGFQAIDINVTDSKEFPTAQLKREIKNTGIEPVITTALTTKNNPISPERDLRKNAVEYLKRVVDIANELNVKILAGVIYASWGYKTQKPRTRDEWHRSIECIREVAQYARETGETVLAVEVINRYVTHFLNTACDAVNYCEDVGMDNVQVHLDSFHMMIEEESFSKAIKLCGRRLAYFHTCESHRGIPGTGLVPWREVFAALRDVQYDGPSVIESYDPSFKEMAGNSCIWRNFAATGEELAVKGLQFFREVLKSMEEND